jgi:hypothetical protein
LLWHNFYFFPFGAPESRPSYTAGRPVSDRGLRNRTVIFVVRAGVHDLPARNTMSLCSSLPQLHYTSHSMNMYMRLGLMVLTPFLFLLIADPMILAIASYSANVIDVTFFGHG